MSSLTTERGPPVRTLARKAAHARRQPVVRASAPSLELASQHMRSAGEGARDPKRVVAGVGRRYIANLILQGRTMKNDGGLAGLRMRLPVRNAGPTHLFIALIVGTALMGVSTPTRAQAGAAATALTISALIDSLKSLAASLTADAASLIQQGNADLGQQQMLAAGSLTALANQLSDVYKGRLNDTATAAGVFQGNLANDAAGILRLAQGIEHQTATDAHSTVYQLQGSVNQILSRLPFSSRRPVFYGMQVYDVASAFPNKGYDLEFLGFDLTDPSLKYKHPQVVVSGLAIPDSNISVQQDRVQVVLPAAVKSKIAFRKDTCEPPAPFSATLTVFYKTSKRIFFVPVAKDAQTPFTAFSLPGPDAVMAKVTYSGTQHSANDVVQPFNVVSAQVNVGCENTLPGNISFTAPVGAKEINCNAAWVNTSNLKLQSQSCTVGGNVVAASGTITGVDYQNLVLARNCPGGGHGALAVSGTYHLSQAVAAPFVDAASPAYRLLANLDVSIPSDTGRTVERIDVALSRPGCGKPLDVVSLPVAANPAIDNIQNSQNGLFEAKYRNQRLTLTRVK